LQKNSEKVHQVLFTAMLSWGFAQAICNQLQYFRSYSASICKSE